MEQTKQSVLDHKGPGRGETCYRSSLPNWRSLAWRARGIQGRLTPRLYVVRVRYSLKFGEFSSGACHSYNVPHHREYPPPTRATTPTRDGTVAAVHEHTNMGPTKLPKATHEGRLIYRRVLPVLVLYRVASSTDLVLRTL